MPDHACADELRRWSSQARMGGFTDSASLLQRAARHVENRKQDAALAEELLTYHRTVGQRGGLTSFGRLLADTAHALKPGTDDHG